MSTVYELYSLSKELYEISISEKDDDIEQKIKLINNILAKREHILEIIDLQTLKDEEKVYINKVVEMDKEMKEHYKTTLLRIQKKIQNLNKSKSTQKKYLTPYTQVNQISRFFDKKK